MRGRDWKTRLDIMEALGWPTSREEWPAFVYALSRECSLRELSAMMGLSAPTLRNDMAAAGYPRNPTGKPRTKPGSWDGHDLAERTGWSYSTVMRRMRKGQPIDAGDMRGKARRTEVEGKTIRELAAEAGVSYQTMYGRLVREGRHKPDKRSAHERDAARFFGD